jgi:hypothetical protein
MPQALGPATRTGVGVPSEDLRVTEGDPGVQGVW